MAAIKFPLFGNQENYTPDSVKEFAYNLLNIILYFSAIVAGVLIVWAGIKIITSGGNEEQVSSGKNTLKWAVVGLMVIMSAFAIVNFALKTFEVENLNTPNKKDVLEIEPQQ